jgi:hypothetical protein
MWYKTVGAWGVNIKQFDIGRVHRVDEGVAWITRPTARGGLTIPFLWDDLERQWIASPPPPPEYEGYVEPLIGDRCE